MRAPLIDGQGNFGSVDGDPPAAYRYTEARLTALAESMMRDIDKETVDFVPNFDGNTDGADGPPDRRPEPPRQRRRRDRRRAWRPTFRPTTYGRSSTESSVALENKTRRRRADRGPPRHHRRARTFRPPRSFTDAAASSRRIAPGAARFSCARGRPSRTPKKDRQSIIVTEIPYQVNKAKLLEKIGELVRDKKLDGIADAARLSPTVTGCASLST